MPQIIDSKYRVYEFPVTGDLRQDRLAINRIASKVYSHKRRWFTHIGFSKRSDNRMARFAETYGANQLVGLEAKWGHVWLGWDMNDTPVTKIPDWLRRPNHKEELVATVVKYRKRSKSATDLNGKRKTKSAAKRMVDREVYVKSQVTKFHWPLNKGKVMETLHGLVAEDCILDNGNIALAGEHVVREINPTGEVRYFVFDNLGKRNLYDSDVTPYLLVTDELLALNQNQDRLPDIEFLEALIAWMLQGTEEFYRLDELDATQLEMTEWVLDNFAYHSNRITALEFASA